MGGDLVNKVKCINVTLGVTSRTLSIRNHDENFGFRRHSTRKSSHLSTGGDACHVGTMPTSIFVSSKLRRSRQVLYIAGNCGCIMVTAKRETIWWSAAGIGLVPDSDDARFTIGVAKSLVQHVDSIINDSDQRPAAFLCELGTTSSGIVVGYPDKWN